MKIQSKSCQCLGYLFFSGVEEARNKLWIQENQIDAIVNLIPFEEDACMEEGHKSYPFGLPFIRCAVYDRPLTGITWVSPIVSFMDHINPCTIRSSQKKRILVHSQHGLSRSPTLIMYYLMTRHDLSLLDAFRLVREQEPRVCPSIGFMQGLADLENVPTLNPTTYSLIVLQEKFPSCDFKTIQDTFEACQKDFKKDPDRLSEQVYQMATTDNVDVIGYYCIEKLSQFGYTAQISLHSSKHHPFD